MSLRRIARVVLGLVVALFLTLAVLQLFEAGRVLTVRSYVRLDRAWARSFPMNRGKGLVHRLDPLLTRAGLLKPVRVEVEPGVNLLLDPNDDVSRTILISAASRWEPEVWDAISAGLPEGAVFLDVGAHIGYDTLKASVKVGAAGRVVAFEPNPNTLTLLRSNIAASGAANVIVQPVACSDTDTTLTLFDSTLGGNSGSSSLSQQNAGPATRTYTVRARPIDDVIAELGLKRVDVLKADVEGAELLVLRGAAQTLRRYHPKLVLEEVPRQLANMNTSIEELEAFIKSVGYTTMRQVDYKNREWTRR